MADILRATHELERIVGGDAEIGLLGSRMGATLAVLAAEEWQRIGFLVLWDPVVKGRRYIDRCVRRAVAGLTNWGGDLTVTRKTLTAQLARGESIEVDGYELTPGVCEDVSEIDLLATARGRPIACLVLQTQTREPRPADPVRAFGERCAQMHSVSRYAWVQEAPYWPVPTGRIGMIADRPRLVAETVAWLGDLA